jgi:2-methylisocitrate lyase-like PEP mutase family enzyme
MRPTAPTDPRSGLRSAFTGGLVVVPGCHDPLSARLAAEAGAAAVFLAGC